MFIDGAYLQKYFKENMLAFYGHVPQLQYEGLSEFGCQRFYYYDAIDYTKGNDESDDAYKARVDTREETHDHINSLPGFHVREGNVRKSQRKKNREQKGVDVQLAVDAMEHAARANLTHALLLTGDLDFEPLVSSLVRLGIHTHVLYVPQHAAKELLRSADQVTKITLEHFHRWSTPSFRENHRALRIAYREHRPERPIFEVEKEGRWGDRQVTLFRSINQSPPRLFVERGDELREPTLLFEYPEIDKLELAFTLTFGKVVWDDAR